MIAKGELLTKLKQDFRLNIYEAAIWTVLLSRGIATAGELADLSSVPRSRCYDVLESLEKKGFIIMKLGKPIKYIAIQPEEIVERVKKGINEDTEISLRMIEGIKGTDVFKELQLLHKTGIERVDENEISNSVAGRENITHFLKKMVERARSSVLIVATKESFAGDVDALYKSLRKISRRGVKIEIKIPADAADDSTLKRFKDVAELISIDPTGADGRLVIADNELLFITNDSLINDSSINQDSDLGIWVKSEFFTKALREILSSSSGIV